MLIWLNSFRGREYHHFPASTNSFYCMEPPESRFFNMGAQGFDVFG
jgi:hypothetical protein